MTQVVGLIGGSGLGKSTTAAGLFYEMKLRGIHVELVREYVKSWAWTGRKVGEFDQAYLFGKQSQAEAQLYGKVDWIVTDSPLLLAPIYEKFYLGKSLIEPAVLAFLEKTKTAGIQHHHVVLARNKPFDTRGRYETEATARKVDDFVHQALATWKVPTVTCSVPDRERVNDILQKVGIL